MTTGDKEEFWKLMTGPTRMGCFNCKNRGSMVAFTCLYFGEACNAFIVSRNYDEFNESDKFMDMRHADNYLARWEWDSEND